MGGSQGSVGATALWALVSERQQGATSPEAWVHGLSTANGRPIWQHGSRQGHLHANCLTPPTPHTICSVADPERCFYADVAKVSLCCPLPIPPSQMAKARPQTPKTKLHRHEKTCDCDDIMHGQEAIQSAYGGGAPYPVWHVHWLWEPKHSAAL